MIYYSIDKSKLYALIDEEVSLVADVAYAEGGQSLYDSIVLTEKDKSTVERFMEDALNAFVAREEHVSSYSPLVDEQTGDVITPRISLDLPDLDSSRWAAAQNELDRYVVSFVCAYLFHSRKADKEEEYTARAESSLSKTIALLKTRRVAASTVDTPELQKNKATEVGANSDHAHYPSALAVYTAIQAASYVNSAAYNSNSKKIELKHGSTVIAEVDATAFIVDGMVSSVKVENGNLVITFNTDADKEDVAIPISSFFDSSQYYNKSDVNSLFERIDERLLDFATRGEIDSLFAGGSGVISSGGSEGGGSGSGPATIPDDTNGGNWVQLLGNETGGDCRHGDDIVYYEDITINTWFYDYDGNQITVTARYIDTESETVMVSFDGRVDGIEINSSVSHYVPW